MDNSHEHKRMLDKKAIKVIFMFVLLIFVGAGTYFVVDRYIINKPVPETGDIVNKCAKQTARKYGNPNEGEIDPREFFSYVEQCVHEIDPEVELQFREAN